MRRMLPYLRNLQYIIRHKALVYKFGRKLGVPLWRCIKHDWSKFTPIQLIAYTNYFYKSSTKPTPPYTNKDPLFDRAWLMHIHHEDHHWQHWVLREDNGGVRALPMPWQAVAEMAADWAAMGTAAGSPDIREWYEKRKQIILLHPATEQALYFYFKKLGETCGYNKC